MRKAGIDGKEFSRKYGGRVPEAVVGDDAIDGECVACFGSICTVEGVREKFIGDENFNLLLGWEIVTFGDMTTLKNVRGTDLRKVQARSNN